MPKGCSKCGTQNADDAKFCRGCGVTLGQPVPDTLAAPPAMRCAACAAMNPAGARFCAKCGADQSELTVMPAPLSAAPAPTSARATAPTASEIGRASGRERG